MNKVLLFAHLKEQAGKGKLEVNASGKTIGELRRILERDHELGNLEGIMIALNEEFAKDDALIQTGDEIALIPPVSGG
ncbi:MAG TPA: molybdopterin converting factor subunit 1 [Bacillaceae bacterium]